MSADSLGIENVNIKTRPGVELDDQQRLIVGCVLDLFAGRASLKKLELWKDDGVFTDPITNAIGRKQFEPQWYGLQTAFSEIERLHHEVTDVGNPISMDLKTRYKVKGIGKETTIASKVNIFYDKASGKIEKVEDKWDGKLPESSIANVSARQLISPFWWLHYAEAWAFWTWSFVWYTRPWEAFRRLNAVTVPHMVGVPKSDEEDAKKGNQ
ncbi:MAG: hypothetical protein M1817_005918 [Caeruleum heppii]|nr:MAG: hypothetical protein M1817_005918 [Caeruleum heppii]